MALKITKKIGTDLGITSEAYVRIVNYNINKNGIANFALQTFMTEADAVAVNSNTPGSPGTVRNVAIGDQFTVHLVKEETAFHKIVKPVQKEVEVDQVVTTQDADGNPVTETIKQTVMQTVMEEVEESYPVFVPDLSGLKDQDIFSFAYGKLKEKLGQEFGKSYIADC
jgi:hypothetical protein